MNIDKRPVDGSCIDCKYYYDAQLPDIGCGECRYGPPTAIKYETSIVNGYYSGKFPLVSEYEWCWRFNKKCVPTQTPKLSSINKRQKDRRLKAKEKFDKIITPEVLKEAEEFGKQIRRISVEELHRPFTI